MDVKRFFSSLGWFLLVCVAVAGVHTIDKVLDDNCNEKQKVTLFGVDILKQLYTYSVPM